MSQATLIPHEIKPWEILPWLLHWIYFLFPPIAEPPPYPSVFFNFQNFEFKMVVKSFFKTIPKNLSKKSQNRENHSLIVAVLLSPKNLALRSTPNLQWEQSSEL
jgi:hypothetical protein